MSNPAGTKDHTGTTCPICNINGVCGHEVKYPPVPPWVNPAVSVRFTTP